MIKQGTVGMLMMLVGCGLPVKDFAENVRDTTATNLEYASDYIHDQSTAAGKEIYERASEVGEYIHIRFRILQAGPEDGADGKDGESIVGPVGPQGERGQDGESIVGPQGEPGKDAEQPEDGEDGTSCGIRKDLLKAGKKKCLYEYVIVCGEDELKIKSQVEDCED